jgi:hypothetical protein
VGAVEKALDGKGRSLARKFGCIWTGDTGETIESGGDSVCLGGDWNEEVQGLGCAENEEWVVVGREVLLDRKLGAAGGGIT